MNTKEIIEKQLKILPKQWFDFVVSDDWKDDLLNICLQLEISEDKYISVENQVFLVLIAIEHPNNLFLDLEEVGIETEKADKITSFANKEIFTKIKNYLTDYWQSMEMEFKTKEAPKERQSNVGNDFERIMETRRKAMQPAIDAKSEENIGLNEEKPRAIHNYLGSDPYREPIE